MGHGTTPSPLAHDLTKPAGATAKPAEPALNPTGQATTPGVYITHPTHGARASPAATHNTNSDPVSHTECQSVRSPVRGRQREEQSNPPLENKTQKGGTLTHSGTRSRRRTGKKENWGDSHTTAKPCTHTTIGGQPSSQATRNATPTAAPRKNTRGPPRLARRRPAKSSSPPQPHGRRRAGGKDTSDTPAHNPPEKWRATGNTDADTAKKIKQREETQSTGGGKAETKGPRTETAAGDPKKRPQGDNASPEGKNSKKRQLAWMTRSLIAAGVDVKFPDEE